MKSYLTNLANLSKRARFALAAALMAATMAVPAIKSGVTAQNTVRLESYTFAQNVSTNPDGELSDSTSLKVDEVARVHTWVHNRELPDSGLNAEDLNIKLAVPTASGKTQKITGTSDASNAAAVSDTTTVNLSLDRARLEVVPNSATYRYNKGAMDGRDECQTGTNRIPQNDPNNCYVTENLSAAQQTQLLSPQGLVLEDEYRPCFAYEASVSVQVRSVAEAAEVNKYVREIGSGQEGWTKSLAVEPGQEVEYLISFTNRGNKDLSNVVVADNLPLYHSYVDNTAKIKNSQYDGNQIANDEAIFEGGFNTGDYAPGAGAHIWFTAKIDPINVYERCGDYIVRNVGFVNPDEVESLKSTAEVKIKVVCDEQPEEVNPVCTNLVLTKLNNKSIKVTVNYDADGTTFENATINFGDGTDELLTNNVVDVPHTYDELGTYVVTAVVNFTHEDETFQRGGEACKASVNFSTTPTPPTPRPPLPNTGAGEVVGLFAAVTTAGAIAHKYVFTRRIFG